LPLGARRPNYHLPEEAALNDVLEIVILYVIPFLMLFIPLAITLYYLKATRERLSSEIAQVLTEVRRDRGR